MIYSTDNLQISLTMALATFLRENGYDVFWHQTGTTDLHTSEGEARAEITLVADFPANPATIVRLKTENTGQDYIVVPALTLHVLDTPRRGAHMGLGHSDYTWDRDFRVDGLAADEFQHRELQDLLHDWLHSEDWKEFAISDYDEDADAPPALDPVYVRSARVDSEELSTQIEAVRYYVRALATVTYIE